MKIRRVDELPAVQEFEIVPSTSPLQAWREQNMNGFQARGRSDLAAVHLGDPVDWSLDPQGDRNWKFQLQAWRNLDPLFELVAGSKDDAAEWAPVLAASMLGWHGQAKGTLRKKWAWYDMSTGIRADKLAYFLVCCEHHGLNALVHNPAVEQLVEAHLAELANWKRLNPGNHGFFQLNGLMALLWAVEDASKRSDRMAYALHQMMVLLRNQIGEKGVHREHSPQYHYFVMAKVQRFLDSPKWRSADLSEVHHLMRNAEAAGYWLVDPASRCVPVGDSGVSRIKLRDQEKLLAWPHETNANTVGAVLDGYGVVRSEPGASRSRRSLLFLQGGFFNATHKHADCLSFVWQERGEYVLIDSGKYGYTSDPMRNYVKSTRAHNTVEVDGRSLSVDERHAYGSAVEDVKPLGEGWLVRATMRRPEHKFVHRRRVLYLPQRMVVVLDELENLAWSKRDYAACWHFNPDHQVARDGDGRLEVTGLAQDRVLTASFFSEGLTGTPSLAHVRGQKDPEYMGWVSQGYLEARATTSARWGGRSQGRTVLLGAVFQVGAEAPKSPVRIERSRGRLMLVGPQVRKLSETGERSLDLDELAQGPQDVKS